MSKLILFNKPFNVLSQFTTAEGKQTLKDFIPTKAVYPAGRLDLDSEGLLLLTDDGKLQHVISHPLHKMTKCYWAQIEGIPSTDALKQLQEGVMLKDGLTLPATANLIDQPSIWTRTPPIRQRKNIPTSWIELSIREGKNRQVRRMTAAVNHPTLRLIRKSIGPWSIEQLAPGEWQSLTLSNNDLVEFFPDYFSSLTTTSKTKNRRSQNKSHERRR